MDYRWYVAQALPGLEGTAIYHLKRENIVGFAPAFENRRLRLYPNYVFVELENFSEVGIVNRQRGIRRMLPIHAVNPLPLPVGFIEELRGRISRKEFDESAAEEHLCRFVPQQEVIVKTGPFRDHHGRFLRYSKGAAVVVLSLLGREFELKRPTKEFSPAPNPIGPDSRSAFAPIAA